MSSKKKKTSKDEIEEIVADKIEYLTKNKDSDSVVGKYYLQLILLIFVHLCVFWFFPIKANILIQGHGYCDYEDKLTSSKCNEVRQNWGLICFYLLYCLYFYLSALQIRFGMP